MAPNFTPTWWSFWVQLWAKKPWGFPGNGTISSSAVCNANATIPRWSWQVKTRHSLQSRLSTASSTLLALPFTLLPQSPSTRQLRHWGNPQAKVQFTERFNLEFVASWWINITLVETRGAELALASPLRNGSRSGPQVLMEPLSGNNQQATSPKFSTARPSPATTGSPSSLVGGESSSCSGPFVSCDRLDSSPDVVDRWQSPWLYVFFWPSKMTQHIYIHTYW